MRTMLIVFAALAGIAASSGVSALDGRFGEDTAIDDAPKATEAVPAVPLERYREVLARPLFSPSRRPVPAGPDPRPEAEDAPVVQGVVLARDKRIAIIAYGNPSTVRRVKEGQDIGPWRVEKIVSSHVILRAPDGKSMVVRLKIAGPTDKARQALNTETTDHRAVNGGSKR